MERKNIKLNNIKKKKKKNHSDSIVIQNLSFIFETGIIYSIQGPSGCGKSTLLNIISGADREFEGTLSSPPKISVSYQGSVLLPWLTAKDIVNIVIGDKKETFFKACTLLKELGINETSKMPKELSGGMKIRVDIARALAYDADLYLFDEPFSNLDSESARICAETIKNHTRGKTVISVIHNGTQVKDFADIVLTCEGNPFSTLKKI